MAAQEKLCFKGNKMTLYFLCLHLLKKYTDKKKGGGGVHVRWQYEHKLLLLLNCKTTEKQLSILKI